MLNAIKSNHVFSEEIDEDALPMTITKSREVRFSTHLWHNMIHRRFVNVTQILWSESNRKKLENMGKQTSWHPRTFKVDVTDFVPCLKWTPIFEWWMVGRGSKNGHKFDECSKKI